MDRDEFILTVYCVVCEHYQMMKSLSPLRRGGFAPALSEEEVITREIGGEYFKRHTDKDLFGYLRAHSAHFFPRLTERTLCVRQAANLWQVQAAMQARLTRVSGQAADGGQSIDPLPLPVCGYPRSGRDRCCKPFADSGHCAAKQLAYYGFKLGLRSARCGMITGCPLLPARPHDSRLLDELGEGLAGVVPADKGLIDAFRQAVLAQRHGVLVVIPVRKGMTTPHSATLLPVCARLPKGVETVGSHLTERFAVARSRVPDLWHLHHRLIRKVLAHTGGVFLNLQLGRPPLDLDGLVTL
jgi:hypothetical protein